MWHKPYIIQFVFLFFLYQTFKYLWKYETLRMESNADCDRWFKIYFIFFKRKKYIPDNGDTPINLSEGIFFFFFTPCILLSFFALSLILYHLRSDIKLILNFIFYSFLFILHILMYIGRLFSTIFLGIKNFDVVGTLSFCNC